MSSPYCTTRVIDCSFYTLNILPQQYMFRGNSVIFLKVELSRAMNSSLERSIWENFEHLQNEEIIKENTECIISIYALKKFY